MNRSFGPFIICVWLSTINCHAAYNPKDIESKDLVSLSRDFGKALADVIEGAYMLDSVEKPLVTFFGGSRVKKNNPDYKKAHNLAQQCALKGYGVITGGGSGIMEAANCGALVKNEAKKDTTSMAIGIAGLGTQNTCTQKRLTTGLFFPRKWLLMAYSSAFIFLPGGVGTLDELGEILTLISTDQMSSVPIFIVGQKYWKYMKRWFRQAVRDGLMTQRAFDLMTFTDNENKIIADIELFIDKNRKKQAPVLENQQISSPNISEHAKLRRQE